MKKYLLKLKTTASYTFILLILFGILGPLEIYSGNIDQFEFGFHDFFWMFLGIYTGIWILGTALIALLPQRNNRIANLVIFIVGIECYLQSMFFNKKLITDDGSKMVWSTLKTLSILNIIIWILIATLIVTAFLKLKNNWETISKYIMLFLCLIQIVAIISIIISIPKKRTGEYLCKIDATKQLSVASEENIIVFVLDKYANKQFNIAIENHPEMMLILKDFTYYNNANSMYEHTDYGLCVMLAGQIPGDDENWRDEAWSSKRAQDFYDILHKHGYQCFISTRDSVNVFGKMENLIGKFDNVNVLGIQLDSGLLFRLMTKMNLYKEAPYLIKPYLEVTSYAFTDVIHPVDYRNSTYIDPEYYQLLINERMSVDDTTKKLFKVEHIQGMHGDYNMDENAIEIPESEGTIDLSRDGMNTIIVEYIEQLKDIGAYDNATIIIVADHGDENTEFGMQPLFLIKRAGETNSIMQVNAAPISHKDFIPTILDILGEDYSDYGTSIYDWNEGDERERTVTLNDGTKYTYYTEGAELEKIVDGK